MNKTIVTGIGIALVGVAAWFAFKNNGSMPAANDVEHLDTVVTTQEAPRNNTKTTATPVATNTGRYENTTIGASFSYPSSLTLEKDSPSTDPNVVAIGTQRLTDGTSGKTYVTIYDRPVAVGSMGTQIKVHKERIVNGKTVRMYYETSGSSETPLTIGIGWDSEATAQIVFTPSQLPNNLKDLPDTVFTSLQLR